MKRLLSLLVAILVAAPLLAAPIKVFDGATAEAGASQVYDTQGAWKLSVQACGTGFSGVVYVNQGEAPNALTPTKTLTLTDYGDCSEYYLLDPSSYTQVSYSRTAGALTVYLGVFR